MTLSVDCARLRAGRAIRPVQALVILLALILLAACGRPATLLPPDEPPPLDTSSSGLQHLVGAYALNDFHDVGAANRLGVEVIVGRYSASRVEFNAAIQAHGTRLIDTWIQEELYRAYCPQLPPHCAPLSVASKQALLQAVDDHLRATAASRSVVGYYLVDDYWTDMSDVLPELYEMIRLAGGRPTVCGLALPLDYIPSTGAPIVQNREIFLRALRNYSPGWCDAVMLYAYGPILQRRLDVTVDRTMHDELQFALAELRVRGWQPQRQVLIGMVQAFWYDPRIGTPERPLESPEWVLPPTDGDLRRQIAAFCAAGAAAIIAYAWNDESIGTVGALHNDPRLQLGFQEGIRDCRMSNWR